MAFIFQQPGTARLLEAIDQFASDANEGGGVFAFATRDGIEKLLDAPKVARHLRSKKPFRLVVGMDAITNAAALLSLADALGEFPKSLTAKAFFHEHPASTFHPKFCWFKQGEELRLITGSGNLTSRGLGLNSKQRLPAGNWEAFTTQTLSGSDALRAQDEIERWFHTQQKAGTLCDLDDPRVQSKAMENGRVRYTPGARPARRKTPPGAAYVAAAPPPQDVLMRELPKNRHGQADIGQAAMTAFFGFTGVPKDVLLQHVSLTGALGPVKHKRLFVNKSRNYRLELDAISPLPYRTTPDDGRMILVATRLDERSFRYTIVPVDEADYAIVSELLGPIPVQRGRSRAMRERKFTAVELRAAWPSAPEELLPLEVSTPEP